MSYPMDGRIARAPQHRESIGLRVLLIGFRMVVPVDRVDRRCLLTEIEQAGQLSPESQDGHGIGVTVWVI